MATDVLLAVHLPFAAQAQIPEILYKVVTMPVPPRANEEVWFPGDGYLFVSRVRYSTEDFDLVLHFDDATPMLADWSSQSASDLNDALQNADFSDTEPAGRSA